jgi:Mlc titration factor MtfA (ptsG expression regulator)
MMRIKMKISYEACKKSITITELFINAILKAYKCLYYDELKEILIKPESSIVEANESSEESELIYKQPEIKRSQSEQPPDIVVYSPIIKQKRPLMNVIVKGHRKNSRNEDFSMYEYPRFLR